MGTNYKRRHDYAGSTDDTPGWSKSVSRQDNTRDKTTFVAHGGRIYRVPAHKAVEFERRLGSKARDVARAARRTLTVNQWDRNPYGEHS